MVGCSWVTDVVAMEGMAPGGTGASTGLGMTMVYKPDSLIALASKSSAI